MLPFNYAILKLFENSEKDMCVYDIMDALKAEYGKLRVFKESYVTEALMCGHVNGILDETAFELDKNDNLRVYYQANDEGKKIIRKFIKN